MSEGGTRKGWREKHVHWTEYEKMVWEKEEEIKGGKKEGKTLKRIKRYKIRDKLGEREETVKEDKRIRERKEKHKT